MFVKGMRLCEAFFFEVAKPILDQAFPELIYTAGLLGYGSDVLGYDDQVSTDHMWGPRFYLFLREEDKGLKAEIYETLAANFPYEYQGYSVNFSAPNLEDKGVRVAEKISSGPVSPLLFLHTVKEFLEEYLGTSRLDDLTPPDWLAFSENRLLCLTSGKLFVDGLSLQSQLDKLRFYPDLVRNYLLASNWSLAAEEQAFVRRCADVGDETGSSLACARIAERLMRLAFLYCGRYAPYSKWFGTGFARLPVDQELKDTIRRAVTSKDIGEREKAIVEAQVMVAQLHNRSGLTDPLEIRVQNYFNRKIQVIFADRIAQAIKKTLAGTELENAPLIGSLSEVANFTALYERTDLQEKIKEIYRI